MNDAEGFNPYSANATKLWNTLKAICHVLPKNCLAVFDHFAGLPPKSLTNFLPMFFLISMLSSILQQTLIPPEIIRKPKNFWRFQGEYKFAAEYWKALRWMGKCEQHKCSSCLGLVCHVGWMEPWLDVKTY